MWDWLIGFGIVGAFILTVWAKASRQTVPELLKEIKDIIIDQSEDTGEAVAYYE